MTRALGNGRLLRMLIRMKAISCRDTTEKRAHEITGRLWHYRRRWRGSSWMLTRQIVGHLVYELGYLDIGRLRRGRGREWDGGGARIVVVVMQLLVLLVYVVEWVCSRCCCCRVEEDLIGRVWLIVGCLVDNYWWICCWCRCCRCCCCIDELFVCLTVIVLVVRYSYLVVVVDWRRWLFARWNR